MTLQSEIFKAGQTEFDEHWHPAGISLISD